MKSRIENLRARAKTDERARTAFAEEGYKYTLPAVLSITRDNRLYERDDVKQQAWVFVFEAIDQDKGIGDGLYYVKWYTINRIRDWMGMAVRRHAFMTCMDCGHRMSIKPQRQRVCSECQAGPDRIESKSFIDHMMDVELSSTTYTDDYSALFVQEFIGTLRDDRERDILLGYVADVDRAQLAVRHGVSTGRISQIVNRVQNAYQIYVDTTGERRSVA
jgi:DNA-directed RNA polymerase specialized sigma24 family protein